MAGLLVGDVFANAARAVPGRVAAVLDDAGLTFADLDAAGDRVARALARAGVGRGSRVGCWAGVTLDTLPLFAGLAKLGAAFAPLAATFTVEEAAAVATAAGFDLLVADAAHLADAATVAADAGARPGDITGLSGPGRPEERADLAGVLPLARLAAAEPADPLPTPEVREDDPHVVFFTSGSTGRPKGVVLSHRVNVLRSHPGSQLEPRGPMVCTYPLFHMGAWTISLQQWQARDTVAYLHRADGAAVVDAVERLRAHRLNAVPAVWRRVLDVLAERGTDGTLDGIRFADSGTSTTPPELLSAIQAACPNGYLRVFYGSTEAGNVSCLDGDDLPAHPFGCGLPSPGIEVRLGADDELQVRGPLLFDGYLGDPESTAQAFDGDWYRTGDVARIGADGHLSIAGRLRDVIRTGGETVAPPEVEAVLAGVPGVRDVAVVGIPDVTWGEVVCAVVVPDDPAGPPSLAALRAACAGRLASHKHPRRLELCADLPRTPATGQVRRAEVVRQITGGD